MKTLQGPAVFLAQFIRDTPPFNTLPAICAWAKELGFKGIQLPTRDSIFLDLKRAAESKTYADEVRGTVEAAGLQITELSTHLQGHLVANHPGYDALLDGFGPESVRGNPKARQQWAVQQLMYAAKASENLGLVAHATFSGGLLWPMVYPWPRRPQGLVDMGFTELARRWLPILNAFDECGVNVCYEVHPGEDLHDGASYETFLEKVNHHPRACLLYDPSHLHLQCMDYLEYIDIYHERIKAFHVKDAEFRPTGRQGVYGGYQNWIDRAGRFRSLGDGQIDFKAIFSKLAQYSFSGWAVLEWECPLKNPEDGAREGAAFIADHIIGVTNKAFDDFAGTGENEELNGKLLGLT
jgi:sugar phosphate isomerase/epimerase